MVTYEYDVRGRRGEREHVCYVWYTSHLESTCNTLLLSKNEKKRKRESSSGENFTFGVRKHEGLRMGMELSEESDLFLGEFTNGLFMP